MEEVESNQPSQTTVATHHTLFWIHHKGPLIRSSEDRNDISIIPTCLFLLPTDIVEMFIKHSLIET